jgi:hypothetical protein
VDCALSKHTSQHESASVVAFWRLVVYKTDAIYCDRDDQMNNSSDENCHFYRHAISNDGDPCHKIPWNDEHIYETVSTN